MYNLQATLREITVLDLVVQEITVEVVDLPIHLDMSENEVEIDFPDLSPTSPRPPRNPPLGAKT